MGRDGVGSMNGLVFVTHPAAISDAPGGLQLCSHEFLRTFQAGGFDVTVQKIEHDRRLTTRLQRRVIREPYPAQWHPQAVSAIAAGTPDGLGNMRFAALANCPPHIPFFPAAYYLPDADSRPTLVAMTAVR